MSLWRPCPRQLSRCSEISDAALHSVVVPVGFHRIDGVVVRCLRVSVLGRPYFCEEPGGNCLSNFSTPLFRFWMFLLELLEIVSLELPLHTSCFVFVSNRSTTNVPTLYVSVVVVASPKPPPPKPLQPQPPPNPS